MDTRDQTLIKLTRLHGKSHPTHHRPASLRWNYSRTAVSIMKLVMEDGWWWWWWRRIPLSGAPNGLQISPPNEEQEGAAAPYCKMWWFLLSDFSLPESEYMESRLRSVERQGSHEAGGAPPTLVDRVWALWHKFFRQYFLFIPQKLSVNFQVNTRTLISAQI